MNPPLPVPSPGALRALRQIALATSYTIAIGTAVIAEDRRRRIHTVQEARENARLIRGSKKYCTAGAALLEIHDEEVSRDTSIGSSKQADKQIPQKLKSTETLGSPELHMPIFDVKSLRGDKPLPQHQRPIVSLAPHSSSDTRKFEDEQKQFHATQACVSTAPSSECFQVDSSQRLHENLPPQIQLRYCWPKPLSSRIQLDSLQESRSMWTRPPEQYGLAHMPLRNSKHQPSAEPSKFLNSDIQTKHLLGQEVSGRNIKLSTTEIERDSAVTSENFEFYRTQALQLADLILKPMQHEVVPRSTLESCMQLSQACILHDTVEAFLPAMQAISETGGVDSEFFHNLCPDVYISRLLDLKPKTGESTSDYPHGSVEEAARIFLTPFKDGPQNLTPDMLGTAIQLFEAALEAGLYNTAVSIYFRLSTYSNFTPYSHHILRLVLAIRDRGDQKHLADIFTELFTKTQPSRVQFNTVVNETLKATCELKLLGKAEDVLRIATDMGKPLGFKIRSASLTKLLDNFWKVSGDFQNTQALFLRLQPLALDTGSKNALCRAMVRFCIEDKRTKEAARYVSMLADNGQNTLDLRTSSHLILGKAMKGDWKGVVTCFKNLMEQESGSTSDYTNAFTPIFKLYADSHTIPETEIFVHLFLEDLGIRPNQYIFNIMVSAYAKAEDIEAIASWITAMRPYGLKMDSITFNSIMSKSFDRWPKRVGTMTTVCEKVQAIDESLVDNATINILRTAVLLSADGDAKMAKKSLNRVERLQARIVHSPHVQDVLELITRAITRGKHSEAVQHYRRALQDGVMIPPGVVALAIMSCLACHRVDHDIGPAVDLIVESQACGLNTLIAMEPLLLSQAQIAGRKSTDVETFLQNTLTALNKRGLRVPADTVTTVVAGYIDRGEYRQALHVWFHLQKHNGTSDEQIDLVSLTVLVKCFIALSDIPGINWAIGLLCRNGLTPDRRLKLLLQNSLRMVRAYLRKHPESQKESEMYDILEISLKKVMALRVRLKTRHLYEREILSVVKGGVYEQHRLQLQNNGNLLHPPHHQHHPRVQFMVEAQRRDSQQIRLSKPDHPGDRCQEKSESEPQSKLDAFGPTSGIRITHNYSPPKSVDSWDHVPEIACTL